jgi:Flp pilus assembly protein TadD
MRVCSPLLLALFLTAVSVSAQNDESVELALELPKESSLEQGITLFLFDNVAGALPYFRNAITEEPRNPDAYAWLADALLRTGEMDEADRMARLALKLAPCHAPSHATLGDLYNPQYSSWMRTNSDTT